MIEPHSESRLPQSLPPVRRFQFSLWRLMIVMTVVAILLGIAATIGPVFGYLGFFVYLVLRCVLPTPLVICAIFGRGKVRAFSIGAIMPWVLVFPWDSQARSWQAMPLLLVVSGLCGAVAIVTWRWLLEGESP
jgi:hypothetical protein